MNRFILSIICSCVFALNSFGQNIKLEGVESLLAKEDKFDHLSVYLTNGKPNLLNIYVPKQAHILLYKENPLNAVPISESYNTGLKCWQVVNPKLNCGYLIKEKDQLNRYIYLLNYQDYTFQPSNLIASVQSLDPCRRMLLSWQGAVKPMLYYGSSAVPQKLKRGVELQYNDFVYSAKDKAFVEKAISQEIELNPTNVEITSSLADTRYTLVGDKWQKAFHLPLPRLSSTVFETRRVEVHSLIKVLSEDGKEVDQEDWGLLSAPIRLELKAIGNEPATARYRWRITHRQVNKKDPETVLDYTGNDTEYTLDQAGYYHISLTAFGRSGACSDASFQQELRVQESKLEVPNAFSPFDSAGINDVFRVSAKSLISFEGHIFATNGQKLYSWYDVEGGWDGRYKGRKMPMGAYYYVIIAKGADGIQYNKKGVVNLIRKSSNFASQKALP